MGRRGPPPKPTALRVLQGDRPYRINTREPKPEPGVPKMPTELRKEARAYWRRLIRLLRPMRVLTVADGIVLMLLADALADRYIADLDIRARGQLTLSDRGALVTNPSMRIKRLAAAEANRLSQQFGLSPTARVSLTADPDVDSDGAEALLS